MSQDGGLPVFDAIRHQEDAGKLEIARFHNVKDAVTHILPRIWRYSKRRAKYYHMGLEVELPLIRKRIFKVFGEPQPKVQFVDPEKWWPSYTRQWREFYGFNIPIRPWMLANHHSLMEHQQRMLVADSDLPLVKHTFDEVYQMRDKFTSNKKDSLLGSEEAGEAVES